MATYERGKTCHDAFFLYGFDIRFYKIRKKKLIKSQIRLAGFYVSLWIYIKYTFKGFGRGGLGGLVFSGNLC